MTKYEFNLGDDLGKAIKPVRNMPTHAQLQAIAANAVQRRRDDYPEYLILKVLNVYNDNTFDLQTPDEEMTFSRVSAIDPKARFNYSKGDAVNVRHLRADNDRKYIKFGLGSSFGGVVDLNILPTELIILGLWTQSESCPQRNNCYSYSFKDPLLTWTSFPVYTFGVGLGALGLAVSGDTIYAAYQKQVNISGIVTYTTSILSLSFDGDLRNTWDFPSSNTLDQSYQEKKYALFLNPGNAHTLLALTRQDSPVTSSFLAAYLENSTVTKTATKEVELGSSFVSVSGQKLLRSVYQLTYSGPAVTTVNAEGGSTLVQTTPASSSMEGILSSSIRSDKEVITQAWSLDPRNFSTLIRPMVASCDSGPAIAGWPSNLEQTKWTLLFPSRQQMDSTNLTDLYVANLGSRNSTTGDASGPISTAFSRRLQLSMYEVKVDKTDRELFWNYEVIPADVNLYSPSGLQSYFENYFIFATAYAIAGGDEGDDAILPYTITSTVGDDGGGSHTVSRTYQWGGMITTDKSISPYLNVNSIDLYLHMTSDRSASGPRPIPDLTLWRDVGLSLFPRGGSNNPFVGAALTSGTYTDGNRNNLHVFTDYLLDQGGNQHNGPCIAIDQNNSRYFAFAEPQLLLAGVSTYKLCGTSTPNTTTIGDFVYGGGNTIENSTDPDNIIDTFYYIPDLKFVWKTYIVGVDKNKQQIFKKDFTNYVAGACITETLRPVGSDPSNQNVGGTTSVELPLVDNIWKIAVGDGFDASATPVLFILHDKHIEGPSHPPTACITVMNGFDGTIMLDAIPLTGDDSLLASDLYNGSGDLIGFSGDRINVCQGGACSVKAFTGGLDGNPFCYVGAYVTHLTTPPSDPTQYVWLITTDLSAGTASATRRNPADYSNEHCPIHTEWETFTPTQFQRFWLHQDEEGYLQLMRAQDISNITA